MGRILAIDFGLKRTGLAVTDSLKIIANGLETVPTHTLLPFLDSYFKKEAVDEVVIGMPKNLENSDAIYHPAIDSKPTFKERIFKYREEKFVKIILFIKKY
jgi:putative Holliday junction resolvase